MKPGSPIQYILYRLKARSRFDIHSPFVYHFYSKVLKDRSEFGEYNEINRLQCSREKKKYYKLIFRLSHYFKPGTIMLYETNELPASSLIIQRKTDNKVFTGARGEDGYADMILIDLQAEGKEKMTDFSSYLQHIHPGTVLILWNLRKSEETLFSWGKFKNLPGATVTIDLFRLGLIFFRKELSREDYIIGF